MGELDLGGERLALGLAGGVFVEVVETRFADGDHIGVVEVGDDRVDSVLGLVGMQAGRGPHPLEPGGNLDRRRGGGRIAPDGDHRANASVAGCCHDFVHVYATGVGEVAVGVDVAGEGHRVRLWLPVRRLGWGSAMTPSNGRETPSQLRVFDPMVVVA